MFLFLLFCFPILNEMLKFFSIGVFGLLLAACAATQTFLRPGTDVAPGQIAIINQTDSIGSIHIGDGSGMFFKVDIDAGETWISPAFRGRPHIRVYNGERFEEYLLMTGLQYKLYWDRRKNRLDIKMIRQ